MYNKTVLDHFQNPRNLFEMKDADVVGIGANPICGDVLKLYLKIDQKKIKKAAFKTMGCGAAIAAGSLLTEILKGQSLDQSKKLTPKDLIQKLGGLPAIKHHCPELAVQALHKAIKNYSQKKELTKK